MSFGEEDRFRLAKFIKQFASNLGISLDAYNSLDGRSLVHYQCVVRRDEWERVREHIVEAFLVQKCAYRRANGGANAPCLTEDVEPRFAPDERRVELANQVRCSQQHGGASHLRRCNRRRQHRG
ncbi:unnamed protein product [Symbiodinium sp. CCMP2456]|nr:unnamed protein product [Symbiodinium sp. CCMP2456]